MRHVDDLLMEIIDHYQLEDQGVRERQIRQMRRMKYLWEGFSRTWWDEVAHDWRIWDDTQVDDTDQAAYDRPVNVFRAYLESIIAALSSTIPPVTCYPDDADNPLDLQTARAGSAIAKLIYRHNDINYLWIHALFLYCTEGTVFFHNYSKKSEKFGTTESDLIKDVPVEMQDTVCSVCQTNIASIPLSQREEDEFDPDDDDVLAHTVLNEGGVFCPSCLALVDAQIRQSTLIVERIVGKTNQPKARECLDAYGMLYVKVSNYARNIQSTSYLALSEEIDFAQARDEYPKFRLEIQPGEGGNWEPYERWGRQNIQYNGQFPINVVTKRQWWLRPQAFQVLQDEKEINRLKKKFPDGAKVVIINETLVSKENQSLDDHWTATHNPLADYLSTDPLGLLLVSIQDITNDLVSLVLQTIEHGITQTFADPAVLNFDAYRQMETAPGMINPATPKAGKSLQESFYDIKTANLSGETLPFANQIQEYGQLVVGASPTLFGGDLEGSKTASQYSMARTQALQRLQTPWKMFVSCWKELHGKIIPEFIKNQSADERYVEKNDSGDFINVFIRLAELQGKIGNIELEANENLPFNWLQLKDTIMQLMQASNPQVQQWIMNPENLPLIYKAIGLEEFYIPGEDSRNKQYQEIKLLLETAPLQNPEFAMAQMNPEMAELSAMEGIPPPQEFLPSVNIEPDTDNHVVEFEICQKWVNSPAGQLAKEENNAGYQNVLLHAKQHLMIIQQQMAAQQQSERMNEKPNKKSNTPVKEETDVNVTA